MLPDPGASEPFPVNGGQQSAARDGLAASGPRCAEAQEEETQEPISDQQQVQ